MSNAKGSKFHPPVVSGRQKFLRQKEAEKQADEKKNRKLDKLDTSKQNWSIK